MTCCRDQGLSQDLETGCPKLAISKYLGLLFKRDITINSKALHPYSVS